MTTNWTAEERSARMLFHFDDGSFYEQRVLEQPIDSDSYSQKFNLYYFVKDQTYGNEDKPTVLFAAGGPGQMILPDTENFADMYGYRTVYFHLRGTGFSQLPDNPEADKYIRTRNVIEDIEKIREDLHLREWSAVIGHSYGAFVVQCYAHAYPQHVKKVILSAPMVPTNILGVSSKHTPEESLTIKSLRNIYKTTQFRFLDDAGPHRAKTRDYLVDRTQKISQDVEYRFGSVQYVGDNYHSPEMYKELRNANLDYGQPFFGAIRRLRNVGWLPLDVPYAKPISTPKVDDTQLQCGLVIAKAILKKDEKFTIESVLKKGDILKDVLGDGERLFSRASTQNTSRPFYLISIYDGLNDTLIESFKTKRDFPSNHPMMRLIQERDAKDHPKAWRDEDLKHEKPTLILKAEADPVTGQGQANYYFDKAVTSREKVLIELPGIGHAMALPDLDPADIDLLKISVKIKGGSDENRANYRILSPRDKLIDEFLRADSVANFEETRLVDALRKAFRKCFEELDAASTDKQERQDLIVKTGHTNAS